MSPGAAEPAKSRLSAGWIAAGLPVQHPWKLWEHSDYPRETFWKCLRGAVQHKTCANAAVLLSGL